MKPFLKFLPLCILLLLDLLFLTTLKRPAPTGRIPSIDAVYFLTEANNILNYCELGWQGYFVPIFYPFLTALTGWITDDIYYAGQLVSKISRLLLIITVYFLAKNSFNEKVALASAVIVTLMPHLRVISSSMQSESLYSFLITLSLLLLLLTYQRKRWFYGAATGAAFAGAYLTRSEGMFIFIFSALSFFSLALIMKKFNRRFIHVSLILISVFMIAILPYLFYLKSHYGTWTMGTKTASVYFWIRGKAFMDPDPRTEWGLSPKGELNLVSIKSEDVIKYWLKDPEKSVEVYLRNFKKQMPGFIMNGSFIAHYPQVYPLYLVIPMLIGLFIRGFARKNMETDILLISPFLVLFIYPFFTEGWWRYLVTYAPLLGILSVNGVYEIAIKAGPLFSRGNRSTGRGISNFLLILFVVAVSLFHYRVVSGRKVNDELKAYNVSKGRAGLEAGKAGIWARGRFPEDANFMIMPSSRLPYYLGGKWTVMPSSEYSWMIWYAKKKDVDYVVYEIYKEKDYRVLRNTPPVEMDFAGAYESSKYDYFALFYKLKK